MINPIEPVKVLHGHVDKETAYLVDDYPYGRVLRCEIRYWVDTAVKGAAKGQQRFMSQTTNPKASTRVWNNPKASTYSNIVLMFLNEDDHVRSWSIDAAYITPGGDARLRLYGVYEQLTEKQRELYGMWLGWTQQRSQRFPDTDQWRQWDETLSAISVHLDEHGTDPVLDNGVWISPDGTRRYLGHDAEAAIASARLLLAS